MLIFARHTLLFIINNKKRLYITSQTVTQILFANTDEQSREKATIGQYRVLTQ
ncbi:hypothetical protein AArcS_1561 [Natranaeroarchaeum sulfidigenes]|uniref:Uncharacterized protein n=1 Tax=Natranaeroarchaeum sulfidigenes TaxID=2784880 RepID=A0A897MQS2_9EURY|nr:hypothetical protein AArcS_1561 [Natranaeroarchaeum sulfidigenes]